MISLLGSLHQSRLICGVIPVLVFLIMSMLIFSPQVFSQVLESQPTTEKVLLNFTTLLTIIAVISFVLGYVLMIMSWVVGQVFAGYHLPPPIKDILIKIQRKKKRRLARRVRDYQVELQGFTEGNELYQQYWRQYIELKDNYHELFPPKARNLLPTRLGNVYRAFEDYPFKRYGMEGLFFWERLTKVIPDGYAGRIEELNNSIAFLLNTSLASIVVAGEILLKDFTEVDIYLINMTLKIGPISLDIPISLFHREFPSTKILLSLLCLGLGYFFYHAAVSTARIFGRYVRTCYDLFRLDLLDELNVERPKILGGQEEKALWRSVHEFLVLGEDSPYIEESE